MDACRNSVRAVLALFSREVLPHAGKVKAGRDLAAWALGALSVGAAVVLGGIAGITAGVTAGALAALAGLVAPGLLEVAGQRWRRTALHGKRLTELMPPDADPNAKCTAGSEIVPECGVAWLLRAEFHLVPSDAVLSWTSS